MESMDQMQKEVEEKEVVTMDVSEVMLGEKVVVGVEEEEEEEEENQEEKTVVEEEGNAENDQKMTRYGHAFLV